MKKFYAAFICLALFYAGHAQPQIYYQTLATALNQPVKVVSAGDNRLFVGELAGVIKVYDGTRMLPTPFLDFRPKTTVTRSGGFLTMAFHPDYKNNGYFFVIYTERASTLRSAYSITLERYRVSANNPNIADPASGVVIMKILKPILANGTISQELNGSDMHFGKDGHLYFTTGDGAEAQPGDPFRLAQDVESLFGKMLRINVSNFNTPPYYTIPLTNPYNGGRPNTARKEIYSIGLRNPFRWSFDRLNGDMYIGDVGQSTWDEINYTSAETQTLAYFNWVYAVFSYTDKRSPVSNFGWSCYEGTVPYVNVATCTNRAVSFPIFQYNNRTAGAFGATSVTGGYVYRGRAIPSLNGYYVFTDLFTGEIGFLRKNSSTGTFSVTSQWGLPNYVTSFGEDSQGELYAVSIRTGSLYRVVANILGRSASKPEIPITKDEVLKPIKIYPTITSIPAFKVEMNQPALMLELIDLNGKRVYTKNLKNLDGIVSVDVPDLQKGFYLIKITTVKGVETHKLLYEK